MSQLADNVRQVLRQLVPASIINSVTCFAFYDKHPRDEKDIDIIVCTEMGDIREYYKRDLVASLNLGMNVAVSQVRILRNSQSELFYLVLGGQHLTILSRRDKIQAHQEIENVSKYEIIDPKCSGQSLLRVVFINSNLAFTSDDNFENLNCEDTSSNKALNKSITNCPIITHLMRKFCAIKFSVKSSEKSYQDFLKIRQAVTLASYKKVHPNLDDSVFKDGSVNLAGALNIHAEKPWIKTCNKKIIMTYCLCNRNAEPFEDVHILLHGNTKESIDYTTKIFEKVNYPPFWNHTKSLKLMPNTESAAVLVIDLEELKDHVISRLEFNGVLIYKHCDNECIVPIDNVRLSMFDTMGEDFDVLCKESMDEKTILAVLASTQKTDLILSQIGVERLSLDLFCQYLNMDRVPIAPDIVVHRKSPHHLLNGVMIISNLERQGNNLLSVTVHSRSPSQIISLIHYIHDVVPYPIIVTTPTQKITARNENICLPSEIPSGNIEQDYNYMNYATSMLNRTKSIIKYLDNCMIQMSDSRNPAVQSKVGTEIDLFALGETQYKEFKDLMRAEAAIGVKMLNDDIPTVNMPEEMGID